MSFKYEHRTEPLLPRREFIRRLLQHGGFAGLLVLFSLVIGSWGFHEFVPQSWLDAFLNASMLLGGMGPVGSFDRPSGKLFASLFALYAGLIFLAVGSLVLAPILHRMLHKLHLEEERKRR